MKNAFKLLTFFFFIVESFGLTGQGVPESLTGVWKYEIDGLEGMAIISPTHVAWLVVKNNRPNLNGQTLAPLDKVQAYQSIEDIGILTLTLEKSNRCKIRKFMVDITKLKNFQAKFEIPEVEISSGGDMGYSLASVVLSYEDAAGKMVSEADRDFHVWKKVDGTWKLAIDIWNSPVAQ